MPTCHGDWVDLYVYGVDVTDGLYGTVTTFNLDELLLYTKIPYNDGDTVFIHFGVAMKLPVGYTGYLAPRSSTFKKTGLLMTNSVGVIENAYCGDHDEWCAMMYATRDGYIMLGERYHHFSYFKTAQAPTFIGVDSMNCQSRGGYGSTDKK